MNQMIRRPYVPFATAAPFVSAPQESEVQYVEEFTVYNIVVASLAALATFNGNIQIQADTDFVWMKAAYMVDLAGAAVTESTLPVPLCNIQIFDGGSGRQLFNPNPVAIPSIFGRGMLPFILTAPRIFKARSNIAITINNTSAATTYTNLRLEFIGNKKYRQGPPNGG